MRRFITMEPPTTPGSTPLLSAHSCRQYGQRGSPARASTALWAQQAEHWWVGGRRRVFFHTDVDENVIITRSVLRDLWRSWGRSSMWRDNAAMGQDLVAAGVG